MLDQILKQYGIDNYTYEFIRHNQYVVYQIKDLVTQKKYALKIISSKIKNLYDDSLICNRVNFEGELLSRLSNKGLNVVKPVFNNQNQYLTIVSDEIKATLQEWIEGQNLDDYELLTSDDYYDIGLELANFHIVASNEFRNSNYSITQYDNTFALKSLKALLENHIITDKQYDIFYKTLNICNKLMEDIPFLKKGILHGDFQTSNIIYSVDKKFYFIDLSSYCYGYLIYDLVDFIATSSLEGRKEFISGYRNVFPEIKDLEYLLSGLVILSYINAYYMHMSNPATASWLKSSLVKLEQLTIDYFLKKQSIVYRFDGIL